MDESPKFQHVKPPLGRKPALGHMYSVFRYPRLLNQDDEPSWVGRFEDMSFDGFENEAQALRWVVRQMDLAYRDALEKIARLETDRFLVDFQVAEVTGLECALCGKGWTDDELREAVYFHHAGRDEDRPKAAHITCYRNFVIEIEAMGVDWDAKREQWRVEAGLGRFKPGDMTLGLEL